MKYINFFCKKRAILLVLFYYTFGVDFSEATIRVVDFFTKKIVKVKKTKIIYNVAIDTQLELLKKFQRDRVISYIE